MYKLLYVDDEELMRDCIFDAVKWEDYSILPAGVAENGVDALKIAVVEKPDIVVTDIMMPHMDGLELVRELRKIMPGVRIIILSGYNEFTYAQKAIEYKVTSYILKPFVPQKLIDAVKNAVTEIENERGRNFPNRDIISISNNLNLPIEKTTEPKSIIQSGHAGNLNNVIDLENNNSCRDKLAIEQSKNIIQGEYMKEGLCLNSIADQVHLSPGYLRQLFKKATGESLNSYLTSVRIKHAHELLLYTEKKLHEIALEVGYKDEFYLSNVFKKYYGLRPSDVRTKRERLKDWQA